MKVKKYVVSTITEAMEKIRQELGDNAYILDTKRISKGGFLGIGGKKYLEVTAVLDDEDEPQNIIKTMKKPDLPGIGGNTKGKVKEINELVERNKRLEQRINKMKKMDSIDEILTPGKDKFVKSAQNEILKLIEEQREVSRLIDEDADRFYSQKGMEHEEPFEPLNYKKITYSNIPNPQLNQRNLNQNPLQQNRKQHISHSKTTSSGSTKNELDEIKTLIEKLSKRVILNGANPLISELVETLKHQDLSDDLIEDIINNIPNDLNKDNWKFNQKFKNQLFNIFKNNFNLDIPDLTGTIMFIGPTGVGKTTTLAKIAALNKLHSNKSVAIATIDLYRIAATEQLKTYAEIMDIPASVCYTPTELKATVETLKNNNLILIDTAGRSHKDDMQIGELKMYIDSIKPQYIFLVISANMRLKDMIDVYNKFSVCNPTHLIISKLDETSSYGQIPSILNASKLPLIYITTGQTVPNDIEIPNVNKIFSLFYEELIS
ncbi:flagellar biosynthetic protein FlhF [Marinitoga piezophila KA3]|uniref:Flagellar biosynthesis protein FlhF n=1 Tax=Marinitoga piezophila (strain DSM 14283 / JCM 11233 / KA3) TaxID=443254 RepID=H2J6H3_MARPK|nr:MULTISPECIES: flagellar biosynthesis protein FlhF [Marinitoga]AEX85158.1 flagellar biosynthetic protein FlhF [Marinitoga piezophila KA3]